MAATAPGAKNTVLLSDIAIDNATSPSIIQIHLRHSKIDHLSTGVSVFKGRSYIDLRPVSALLAYIAARGRKDGPLFCHPDGSPLRKPQVVNKVHLALNMLGLNSRDYAGQFQNRGSYHHRRKGLGGLIHQDIEKMGERCLSSIPQNP